MAHRRTRRRAVNPRSRVEYLTLDEFVEAFHAAIAAGQGDAFRAPVRRRRTCC